MSALYGTRFGRFAATAAIAALLLAAVTVTGCGDIKTNPGGPSGTGAAAGAVDLSVPDNVKTQMLGVMRGAGLVVTDPIYVYMNYTSPAKNEISATGTFKATLSPASTLAPETKATIKNVNGNWTVIDVE